MSLDNSEGRHLHLVPKYHSSESPSDNILIDSTELFSDAYKEQGLDPARFDSNIEAAGLKARLGLAALIAIANGFEDSAVRYRATLVLAGIIAELEGGDVEVTQPTVPGILSRYTNKW